MELKKIKDKVEQLLVKIPETRNSDKRLVHNFIREYCSNFIIRDGRHGEVIPLASLMLMPNFESITRARRAIQRKEYDSLKKMINLGQITKIDYDRTTYLPTDIKILQKRRLLQEEYINEFRR